MPMINSALLSLLQLSSPALPIGGFSYSQGLEAAVAANLVIDEASLSQWINDGLKNYFGALELPIWCLQFKAWESGNSVAALERDAWFRNTRETQELLLETQQMGWSVIQLLKDTQHALLPQWQVLLNSRPIALPTAMAAYAVAESIPFEYGATAYGFAWVEAQAAAGGKAIPLGQAAIQRVLRASRQDCIDAVHCAITMQDANLQTFSPGLGILSSVHETQYTRLFRS